MKHKKIRWNTKELINTLLTMGDFYFCPNCNDIVRKGWCCSNCGYNKGP